jgi:hypothetical protein
MKTELDENPRYCQQIHAIVVTWSLCNVEGSDPYHSAQQVHGEESYLDELNKKLLSFQGRREMQVHRKKKNAAGPYFEPHGSSPYIYTTCKNDFHIILQETALSPMCNFFPLRNVPTKRYICFPSYESVCYMFNDCMNASSSSSLCGSSVSDAGGSV